MAIEVKPLFILGYHDYTKNIKMPTYSVNRLDVYNEWKDANGLNHRDVYRTSVEGSFTLWFDDMMEYEKFINDLKTFKNIDGSYRLTVYINNLLDSCSNDFYLDYSPANELPYMGSKTHDGCSVSIKEK